MRITHLGHSCLLVETGGQRLLLDPGSFTAGFEDLEDVDAVLITHQHPDHVDRERLPVVVDRNPAARLLAETSVAAELTSMGLTADVLAPGERHEVGGATVEVVGGAHALIHPDIPRVGNVGLLLRSDGEPTFFHPGDSYDATPDGVDILGLPINAPWTSIRETVGFARAVAAPAAVPIHDAGVSTVGRALYLRLIGTLAPDTELRDLAGAGAVRW
jgi:L-ascorbate metabolism protein UlaG (beta-lactamase superfamily)